MVAAVSGGDGGSSAAQTAALLARLRNTGVAPPQAAVTTAAPPAPQRADPNLWYDPSLIPAALAKSTAGADGRNILQGANLGSIANKNYNPNVVIQPGEAEHYGFQGSPADDQWGLIAARPDQLKVGDQLINATKNADGTYTYVNNFDNPTGNGKKDQANITYVYDPKTGKSTPTGDAYNQYSPSNWIDWGRLATELAAVVGTAGVAGAYVGGGAATSGAGTAGATAGSGEALSGMDLAADAAAGSGNSIEGAAAGLGGSSAGYAPATNSVLADSAANSPGYGASSAGAGTNAGASVGGSSLWESLASKAVDKITDPGTWTDLLKAYSGGGGGASASGSGGAGFRAPDRSARIQAEALRKKEMIDAQNFRPTFTTA